MLAFNINRLYLIKIYNLILKNIALKLIYKKRKFILVLVFTLFFINF